jgi:hypothetical protein
LDLDAGSVGRQHTRRSGAVPTLYWLARSVVAWRIFAVAGDVAAVEVLLRFHGAKAAHHLEAHAGRQSGLPHPHEGGRSLGLDRVPVSRRW